MAELLKQRYNQNRYATNVKPMSVLAETADKATANANTAVNLTYAAVSGCAHVIGSIIVSYSETPTGGKVQIKQGTTVVQEFDILAGGPTIITPPFPWRVAPGLAMTVALAAGGGTCVGKVNAQHWLE